MKVIIFVAVVLAVVSGQIVPSLDLIAPFRESSGANGVITAPKPVVKSVTVLREPNNFAQFGGSKAINQDVVNQENGNYRYSYETDTGIKVEETGTFKDSHSVDGSYSFISPEGQTFSVRYIADENGFQPVGDHLPTPPPTPEAIVRLLKYLQEHPQKLN